MGMKREALTFLDTLSQWEGLQDVDIRVNPIMRTKVWVEDYRGWNVYAAVARRLPELKFFCGRRVAKLRQLVARVLSG